MLQDAHVRFTQWRLGSPKRPHRSHSWSLSLLLVALLLFVLALQPLISPRSRFLRSPNDPPHITPQEMIANELATGGTPAEGAMVPDIAANEAVEQPIPIQYATTVNDAVATEDVADTLAEDTVVDDNTAAQANLVEEVPVENTVPEDITVENNIPQDVPMVEILADDEAARHENDQPSDKDIQVPPMTSVLHPNTPGQAPLNPNLEFSIKSSNAPFDEYEEAFPQYGKSKPGQHYRIQNMHLLAQLGNRESDSVLIISVFNDAESWGNNRSITDFFALVGSFDYPKEKVSIALLTSSIDEFAKAKQLFQIYVGQYPRLSVIFRNDFAQNGLNRINRHADSLQNGRRRMLARYRNYALLTTLESWHQHVLWLDADISVIPAGLLLKMVQSGRDIVEPICLRKYSEGSDANYDYDLNAWVGQRMVRPADHEGGFVPGPLNAKNLHDLGGGPEEFVPLDSVGGTMLYVRADIHRQGVVFPAHYIIGSEWNQEGYDGIETEGLCYSAHFLGFKCWGLPNDAIFHVT